MIISACNVACNYFFINCYEDAKYVIGEEGAEGEEGKEIVKEGGPRGEVGVGEEEDDHVGEFVADD